MSDLTLLVYLIMLLSLNIMPICSEIRATSTVTIEILLSPLNDSPSLCCLLQRGACLLYSKRNPDDALHIS